MEATEVIMEAMEVMDTARAMDMATTTTTMVDMNTRTSWNMNIVSSAMNLVNLWGNVFAFL